MPAPPEMVASTAAVEVAIAETGVGGARKRIKAEKTVTSSYSAVPVKLKLKMSCGLAVGEQLGVSSRSLGNTRLVMPISTLYASPEKVVSDLFCAFHPKRVTL